MAIFLIARGNKLSGDIDMSEVEKQTYHYYKKTLSDGTHIAYLVFDENCFVGSGGVSFFQVMPTFHNPSGKKAYIMNMYTNPEYRRRGIAYKTLDMLIEDTKRNGITKRRILLISEDVPSSSNVFSGEKKGNWQICFRWEGERKEGDVYTVLDAL